MSTLTIPKPKRYDWRLHSDPEIASKKPGKTVPQQNYSVRQILEKFTTGQPISGMVQYLDFDGDFENSGREKPDFNGFMPHPKTLDLVDRQRMAEQAREQLKEIQNNDKKRKDQLAAAKAQDKKTIDELNQKINILENPAGGTEKTK